jgi:putative PIN family toxin of toxin-antitoxin system
MFDLFDLGRYEVLLSQALVLEYEAVLKRPEQMLVHGFSETEISEILDTLIARSIQVKIHYSWRPQLRDVDDELVLEVAINGRADAIVTHNTSDFLPGAGFFGIEITTPGSIIKKRFQP